MQSAFLFFRLCGSIADTQLHLSALSIEIARGKWAIEGVIWKRDPIYMGA